jgi:galactose mutarotase-like enzyme
VTHELHNDRVHAVVDPLRGARLISLSIDGHELLAEDGSFPMIPWAGRIGAGELAVGGVTYDLPLDDDGNAIHGLGRNVEWSMTGVDTFQRTLGAPWPTEGTAELRYELLEDGLRTTLSWADGSDVPCSLGLHPRFRRRLDSGDAAVLTFDPDVMVEREGRLPTGKLIPPQPGPWDDCFRAEASPVLTWPGALAISLASSSPWWVVYDEPAETVCVEPQTAPPDAFAHPALQPDGPWPRSLRFEVRAVPLS